MEIKSDEDRDSEIDRRAGVNAEGGRREVTESVPRSAPSDKPTRRKCGIINAEPSTIVEDDGVPWTDVWDAMKCSGWTWKGESGLMTDYYYISSRSAGSRATCLVRITCVCQAGDCYDWLEKTSMLTS